MLSIQNKYFNVFQFLYGIGHIFLKIPKLFIFSCITIISTITLEILHEVVPSNEEKQVPVRVCRFSPDGKMLAKGHDSGSIQVRLRL